MAKGEQMTEQQAKGAPKGPGSFCVPRAAVEALLDAKATAYEICAYLVLAKYTDESGRYSPASISAMNKATGANKLKGGPIDRAIERLKQIRAKTVKKVSNGRSGKSHAMVDQVADLGPILFERTAWQQQTGEILPDGPTERGLVRYVLPDFGEEKESRIWFGNNLVGGIGGFSQPLKELKNAGDVAARLLLAMYAANDMDLWGGVRPCGSGRGPWKRYEPVAPDVPLYGGARLIRAKDQGEVASIDNRISGGSTEAYWDALQALKSAGLIYEVVTVLNRNATKATFSSGEEYGSIPDNAEPYYELDARSAHGYKPEGEEGIGGATAKTAGELGHPVAVEGGRLDGTYAAIVPTGYPAMIAGVYRLRFRVANPKNAGVKGAWARIHTNNREAFELVQAIRAANKKPALVPPWEANKPQAAATVDKVPT
ncbi:MAG: hypothetical protein KDG57_14360 [Rhodoferax sp.]|nr:hypothetical protein [Rhodoferax sp.]